MKKHISTCVALLLLAAILLPSACLRMPTYAATTPSAEIVSNNIYYADTLRFAFAVRMAQLASDDRVQLSISAADGIPIETITTYETQQIDGQSCFVFISSFGVPFHKLGIEIRAEAQVVRDGNIIARSAEQTYSALEYFFERLTVDNEAGIVNAKQKALYDAVLKYAKAAELILPDAENEKLADLKYIRVGDNTQGLYRKGDRITSFSHGLTVTANNVVVWQVDTFDRFGDYVDSTIYTDADLRASGYTVGEHSAVLTPRLNTITVGEIRTQVAAKGNAQNPNSSGSNYANRASIYFAFPMKAGTKITFTGSQSTYTFAVVQTSNPADVYKTGALFEDSKWITATNTFTMTTDSYPILVIKRSDNTAVTDADISKLVTMFNVQGTKAVADATRGTLTQAEYNRQPALWGSVPRPDDLTRQRIAFAVRMEEGTKITFIGDSAVYNWAVVESCDTSAIERAVDSGWNSSWSNPNAPYFMQLNAAFPILTIKRVDGKALTTNEINSIHGLFRVEGQKYYDTNAVSLETAGYKSNSINHRGYSTIAPENTLAAYRLSAQSGFNMVECDISFTKDGYAVLLHDDTIDRTSNGTGDISSLTLQQVRALDFGSHLSAAFAGEKIPTFDEFLVLCERLGLHPYIELKVAPTTAQAKQLVDAVRAHGMLENCTWISFKEAALSQILAHDPTARVGYLITSITTAKLTTAKSLRTKDNEVFIDTKNANLTEATLRMCQEAGFAVEVYTVNDLAELRAIDPYVSGVTSDCLVAGKYR